MTYALRRLRLKGLIHRLPGTHRYTPTTYGRKVAFFHSEFHLRILRPAWLALGTDTNAVPLPLQAPWISSTLRSSYSTKTPHLLPEQLASILAVISFGGVQTKSRR